MFRTLLAAALALVCAAPALADPPAYDVTKHAPWLTQPADPQLTGGLEVVYQAISAADVATTVEMLRKPGIEEVGWAPVALFGHHPSPGEDVAFGAARGVGHLLLTRLFERLGATNAEMLAWQGITTGAEARVVVGNSELINER